MTLTDRLKRAADSASSSTSSPTSAVSSAKMPAPKSSKSITASPAKIPEVTKLAPPMQVPLPSVVNTTGAPSVDITGVLGGNQMMPKVANVFHEILEQLGKQHATLRG